MGIFDNKEEIEKEYLKKIDAEKLYINKNTFNKKVSEIEATLDKKITKEDLPNLKEFIKKSEITQIITNHTGHILNILLPHLNHRYCTNELFNKVRHDLNVKLKKLDHRWRDI